MKQRLISIWKSGRQSAATQADRVLEHSFAGRVVSALTFIVVVLCLGLWITAFLLFRNQFFSQSLSATVYTNLSCIVFFGGLVVAVFFGAMAGNFLRRAFWKLLVKRYR
jgi:fumarate reductase subunit D